MPNPRPSSSFTGSHHRDIEERPTSSGSLTARNTPRTAGASTPEIHKIKRSNESTSQKALLERKALEEEVQRLAAPLAQGDDLEKLKEMLDEVAYAYTQKELQKASPIDPSKDRRAEERRVKDASEYGEVLLSDTWSIYKRDPVYASLLIRYRRANPESKDQFTTDDGVCARIFETLQTEWPERLGYKAWQGSDKDLTSEHPLFEEIWADVCEQEVAEWEPVLMTLSGRDSRGEQSDSSSTRPARNQSQLPLR